MDQNKKEPLAPESSAVLPEKDYKEAYEQEHYKSTYLAGRVEEGEKSLQIHHTPFFLNIERPPQFCDGQSGVYSVVDLSLIHI